MSIGNPLAIMHGLMVVVLAPGLPSSLATVGVLIGSAIVLLVGIGVVVAVSYRKVDQGSVLIINKMGDVPSVCFTGVVVIPIIHRAEVMDITGKTIVIDRRGTDGLICSDNIRADIKVTFFVRVNPQDTDVMEVARAIGASRASDQQTLEALFTSKFSDGLETIARQLEFQELYTKRDEFKAGILETIGSDLNGYRLDDCAIDYLEQTPITQLDPANVLDSQGIRKITGGLVGEIARVQTMGVTGKAGQATVVTPWGSLKIQIRADEALGLTNNERVMLANYDPEQQAFEVTRIDDMLASEPAASR